MAAIKKKVRTAMQIIGNIFFKLPVGLKKLLLHSSKYYCPVCENHVRLFLPAGAITRMNARCPICGTLERHRLEWVFLNTRTNLFDGLPKRMLHVAPEPIFESKLRGVPELQYVTVDLYDPNVLVKIDLSAIPFSDGSFDAVYCCHVMEHVSDDRKAMSELCRVLKPGGWAMLLVPMKKQPTVEDPSVTSPKEREKLFGGTDHLRAYGPDYVDRLKESGFEVALIRATEILDTNALRQRGVKSDQTVTFCTKR